MDELALEVEPGSRGKFMMETKKGRSTLLAIIEGKVYMWYSSVKKPLPGPDTEIESRTSLDIRECITEP
ncbi:hypothetical protein llap_2910 [Limosa lapponica baueri]|uniref:Uncharacterized protein n=1 Tax=Limosa lapponica baueri TaxID=1758121 RepID=A0A2I0UL97_LIMLA|nr:hypothetical protein llap_2910 [Limosa lapponica baueri]